MPRDAQEDGDAFISEVCWHYFINERTQAEVARLLGVTRLRVNQAIQKARARGMVRIEILSPFLPRFEMQQELCGALGIGKALVVPADREHYDYHNGVGAGLAAHLGELLRERPVERIGVSWGMSIESAVRRLPRLSYPDLEVVSMLGGTSRGTAFNSFSIASGLAERLGAQYSLLAAPVFLAEGVERESFLSQPLFSDHFAKFETLDMAILTASDISPRSFLIANGLPSGTDAETLRAAGGIGDVLGQFLDAEGRLIDHPIAARTVGIPIETVARVPHKIMAAAGPHKAGIIVAAARAGLIDTLVTDDVTAELILGAQTAKEP
ncbi:putative transcriptional regulator protein [Oceanicola granulosus HTCC2516]|uniref:Putative transcriptional regulator protein n=1 Tax=Oceanicola granulosus (strain ATCC BAA-861 / DSM 15982 / KCTC 12143 / HTCC2516) TaxID=314256 RepID=Q2CEV0_OCEGH|nr:sugar-binding domain-containing protein [Oceanicola granulosus]EAR51158.1 putative transcriptional regulator protein [Oceanicola granulosus HTCC2516]